METDVSSSNGRVTQSPSMSVAQPASEWLIGVTFIQLVIHFYALLRFLQQPVIGFMTNISSPNVCVQPHSVAIVLCESSILSDKAGSLSPHSCHGAIWCLGKGHCYNPSERRFKMPPLLLLWHVLSLLEPQQFWHIQKQRMKGFLKSCLLCISKEPVRISSAVIAGRLLKVKKAIWDFEKWDRLLRCSLHAHFKDSWTCWVLSLVSNDEYGGTGP